MGAGGRLRAALATPLGLGAVTTLAALAFLGIFGPVVWGAAAQRVDTAVILQGPSAAHLLGTDSLGRDVLARTLAASRLSMALALLATMVAAAAGSLVGAAPVLLPPRPRRLLAGFINLTVAFPGLLLAIFAASVFGVGARGAVLALGLAGAPAFARLTQTLAASVAGSDYFAAARLLGVGRFRLAVRYVLANVAEPLLINVTVSVGSSLLSLSALSFLGLGVQPPAYDWGLLLNQGLDRIFENPAVALGPGVAIVLAGLAFNLLGEALAQVLGLRTSPPGWTRVRAPTVEVPTPPDPAGPLLRVEGLTVTFPAASGPFAAVSDLDLEIWPGEAVGLVGESGSGKSVTALAIAQLVPHPGSVRARRLELAGRELRSLAGRERQRLLGTTLAMVLQDPTTSLNPALRLGRQLTEVAEVHRGLGRRQALRLAAETLRTVGIADAGRRLRQYPHELSGGMRQRAVVAMGLMAQPRLLLADEPTTSLDVTVQRRLLGLLGSLRERQLAILLISHDLAVVAQLCSRVLVMYAGRIVEELGVEDLRRGPAHPYTRALLAALPDMATDRERPLITIPGQPPAPGAVPPGCPFAPRCAFARDRCRRQRPELVGEPGRRVACWYPQAGAVAEAAS
jgi:peptide/nickel transport system permease protein